jgi:SNF2 family DNA or RNA helicase
MLVFPIEEKAMITKYRSRMKPFAHQQEALDRSWDRNQYALFCEMGTGKSKILIDTIGALFLEGKITAAMIVAPKGVYKNWEKTELPKHFPDDVLEQTDIVAWSPSTSKKVLDRLYSVLKPDNRLKIVVMNIEALSTVKGTNYALEFVSSHRTLVAVDESTTIKNPKAKRTKNIINIGAKAAYRRVMTGSPITQSPMDLYSQCAFLGPYMLGHGSFYSFQGRYAKIVRRTLGSHSFNQIVGFQNLDELSSKLDAFSYRILKKDCLDLPDKLYIRRNVELTDEQAVAYKQMKDNAVTLLEKEGGLVTAQNVLTQMLRLQQICSGFVRSDDGQIEKLSTNKLSELMEVLEEVTGKVIIWGVFVEDLKAIEKAIAERYGQDSVAVYAGSTHPDVRQTIVLSFQDPDHPLRFFVGQSRTGGYGLTLTEASTVIYYSNSFDLEVRIQSEDRAHRIGQKNNVTYIDLVTENTVEEKVLKALREKINIASEVLSEGYKEWLI